MKKVELTPSAISLLQLNSGNAIRMLMIFRGKIKYGIIAFCRNSKICYYLSDDDNDFEQKTYAIDDRLTATYYSFEDAFSALEEICAFHLFYFERVDHECAEYVANKLIETLNAKKHIFTENTYEIGFMSYCYQGPRLKWLLNYDRHENHWSIDKVEVVSSYFYWVSSWLDWDDDLDGPKSTMTYEETLAYLDQFNKEIEAEFGPIEQEENSLPI